MRRLIPITILALLSVGILSYTLLVSQQLFLGLGAIAALISVYLSGRDGVTEHTVVIAALWSVLLAALWTGNLLVVLVAMLVVAVAYVTWEMGRGNGRLSM